jgi:hypothetical protein
MLEAEALSPPSLMALEACGAVDDQCTEQDVAPAAAAQARSAAQPAAGLAVVLLVLAAAAAVAVNALFA